MKVLITTSIATIALAALLTACGDSGSTNVNVRTNNNGMTNLGANNADVGAVVVNSNTNTANANPWANANSVTREDYNRDRAKYEADRGSSTIGSGANDSWMWFKTRAALMTADDLRDSTINVDVDNAVITLKGSVASAAQKASAERVANGIEGKTRVVNQLTVAPNDSMTNMSSNGNAARNTNR